MQFNQVICLPCVQKKKKTIEICKVRLPVFLIGVLYDFRGKIYDSNQPCGRVFIF